jgi:prepilin-type N-terminal cleavage/methylation domain-containing protein
MRNIIGPMPRSGSARTRRTELGFNLIELLVVIAMIAILGALLSPALWRAKEAARITWCLSNLHEIGLATQDYIQENEGRYPTKPDGYWEGFEFGGGDPDPRAGWLRLESATQRPLWSYTTSREVYRCPSDRGIDLSPWMQRFDSLYDKIGTSYGYNMDPPWGASVLQRLKIPDAGLCGQTEGWLSRPSLYILFYEPPAAPYPETSFWRYFFWHYACGKATVLGPYSGNVTDRSISPVLFADGHADKVDFTRAIKASTAFPFEEQPLWYWYEPAP